ncbi:BTAD domain-containing putative transcriptional regulator [Streptomyces sp. NPDC097727]|uniref:AfsR/SARP family transcriptional regulator n=1 Tax=Streptomyces sp. NPDC097727 TaxID=3366092 RepID=UPI0037FED05C
MPAARLLHRVWDDRVPHRARDTLYAYLSRLRRGLEPHGVRLVRRSGGYAIDLGEAAVDLHRFRDLSDRARRAATDEHSEALWREALGLWRGSAFAGVDAPWFNAQRGLLDGERLAAQLERVDVRLRLGQRDRMVSELVARAKEHPLDERVIGQLLLALCRCGRQAEALEEYERARRRLADELGVDPGAALRQLYGRILAGDPDLSGVPDPAAARIDAPSADEEAEDHRGAVVNPVTGRQLVPRLLPADLSLFVGRDAEVDEACRLLGADGPGPLTLLVTGSAGVGKTAFAVRTGHRLASRFPDGQLHADLRRFGDERADPFMVLGAFLRALGVRGGTVPAGLTERIHLYRSLLAQRQVLVVLDNAAGVQQVRDLLPSGRPSGRCARVAGRSSPMSVGGRSGRPAGMRETSCAGRA